MVKSLPLSCLCLLFLVQSISADTRAPILFSDPEWFLSPDKKGYGSELSTGKIFPLNWVAQSQNLEVSRYIRITEAGGWGKVSYLIGANYGGRDVYTIDRLQYSWNPKLGSQEGNGLPELRIAMAFIGEEPELNLIREVLAHPLLSDPANIGPLPVGDMGDDYPFLLIEFWGAEGYKGYLLPMEIYQGQVAEEAQALMDALRRLFEPEEDAADTK